MIYLVNAFSLNMLDVGSGIKIEIWEETIDDVKQSLKLRGFTSAVGHEDTAKILSDLLGLEIPCNRISVKLKPEDRLIVAQYIGPRLEPGTTKLPEGAEIRFYKIRIR